MERSAFIPLLRDLLADSNPTVVANAVAALVEVSEKSDEIALRLNVTVAGKLVAALGECSECVSSLCLSSSVTEVVRSVRITWS
jgi:AP-2 complex subunit beta-1